MEKNEGNAVRLNSAALAAAGVTGMAVGGNRLFSKGFGNKEIIFVEGTDGQWMATCTCDALDCGVAVHMTEEQAAELLLGRRRPIDQILPQVERELREIFITGTTSAEFDKWTRAASAQSRLCQPWL